MNSKRSYLNNAYNTIDAAVFNGDAFYDGEERVELLRLTHRWQRTLLERAYGSGMIAVANEQAEDE